MKTSATAGAATPPNPSSIARESTSPAHHETARDYQSILPKWRWHYRTLSSLRQRLLQAHTDHQGQIAVPLEIAGIDVVDTIRDQMDRDLLWAELGAEENKLCEIDAALQRIREGTYGRCEATGQAIPPARLFALPWTRYCRAMAEKIEAATQKTEKRTGRIFVPSPQDDAED